MENDRPQTTPKEFERANGLVNLWESFQNRLDPFYKDKIGRFFVEHILDLGSEIAEDFDVYPPASAKVVSVQTDGEVGKDPKQLTDFWTKVKDLTPELLPQENDVEFLVQKMGIDGVYRLMRALQADHPGSDPTFTSPVLRILAMSTHDHS